MSAADTLDLERLLAALDDCDLSEWDRDFVDDMSKRLLKHDVMDGPFRVSARQQEQLDRMKDRHL